MKEKLINMIEDLDWGVDVENTSNSETLRLSMYSPAGEDFSILVDLENVETKEEFLKELKKVVYDFDVDEHVDMWAIHRGENGVPSSYTALVEDAKEIQESLFQLYDDLKKKIEDQ